MQIAVDLTRSNPPLKTIEGDIYEAFANAGAILKANAIDPVKVSIFRINLLTCIE